MTNLLTDKEQTILQMRIQGKSNAEIARHLFVTPTDITQTFKRIAEKLTNVNQTVQLLQEAGVIEKQSDPIQLTQKGIDSLSHIVDFKSKRKTRLSDSILPNDELIVSKISHKKFVYGFKTKLVVAQLTEIDLAYLLKPAQLLQA